ncbi:hypothetical protein Cpir12675_002345 [Ceratocystis pirilliformis]|uniref:Uncharacterized protein n=1 Tax=Ceratocystis pirilliformis TaxID=259994 RepID=A0ABR3ZA63_9PEZI
MLGVFTLGLGALSGVVTAPVAVIPGPVLAAAGFGSAGVTAGSIAAWLQTSSVAAGSVFAALQSAGATAATGAAL